MQTPKEIRDWVNRKRKNRGKRNGVVKDLWDSPIMERELSNSKKNYKRHQSRIDFE